MNQIEGRLANRLFGWFSFSRSFRQTKNNDVTKESASSSKKTKSDFEANEEKQKKKAQAIAFGFALTAMIVYAFAIGLIQVNLIKTDLEYYEKA